MTKWIELLVAVLAGLVVCIPLVANLVEVVREAVQERNWASLIRIVMNFMVEAERAFDNGYDRKQWVMSQLDAAAKTANYDLTDDARQRISDMIDAMCTMAYTVNGRE